jgi:hypothetical protein
MNWSQDVILRHSQRLLKSYQRWLGQPLLPFGSVEQQAQALYEAPFVVVSHGVEADPILNYGNQQALDLWEMDWQTLTQTPSRLTAEPINQRDRAKLLAQAKEKGYIDHYRSIRISSTGRRFWIENVTLWTVLDETNQPCGQAATFATWTFI